MIIKPSSKEKQFRNIRSGTFQKKGLTTGFVSMDENMMLAKGYMAIITGYPGSGKSEWWDAVMVNMSLLHDWRVMYYSPENHPVEAHMAKISEKFIGKHITEFSNSDYDDSMDFLSKHFTWMYPENPELDVLLSLATQEAEENGLDCLTIDPWNAVTHHRNGMLHEYLSEALSKVIRLTRDKDILAAIVAHPTKPMKNKEGQYEAPDLYSISDGAMWRNKADYGIVAHRPDMSKNELEIYIQKIKQKFMGKLGMQVFDYNWKNGRFKCKTDKDFLLPTDIESAF